MKRVRKAAVMVIGLFLMFMSINAFAQWQEDSKYGFKIKLPNNWSKNSFMDGNDKVYDYYSPDQNAAIQLRVFEAGSGVTTDILAQVYEESMLPEGTKRESLNDHTNVNGIPGKQGVYVMNYNGNEVYLSAFYTVQNNNGYVLTVIIPTSMIEQKGEEVKEITRSFSLKGFQSSQNTNSISGGGAGKPNKKPAGLGGIMGGTTMGGSTNQSSSGSASVPGDISGRYTFISRSDGPSRTNYHYITINSNGTYIEKYNPKNSGAYEGGHEGTWTLNGNKLTFQHKFGSTKDYYTINGNELKRESGGITFLFRK